MKILKSIFSLLCVSILLAGCGGTESSSSSSNLSSMDSSKETMSIPSHAQSSKNIESSTQSGVSTSEETEVNSSKNSSSMTKSSEGNTSNNISSQGSGTSSVTPQVTTEQLVIPEGYTLARIGMKLEEMGYCTTDQWIQTTQTIDVSGYPLAAAIPNNSSRCYRLEGYLFPATYTISSDDTPEDILRKMLNLTEKKITQELRSQIAAKGMTVDEVITMASIIEKEAYGSAVMPKISSVFYNRMAIGQRLESDVTIIYVEGAIKPFIGGDVNRYNSYYNTYKCKGLPAGAICNPGMTAIHAAINPESTEYYFFVTDNNKQYYFSNTYEEHVKICNELGLNDTYEE